MVVVESTKEFRCTCRKCQASLRYQYSDVYDGVDHDYGGGRDHYQYINCPQCNTRVVVKPE